MSFLARNEYLLGEIDYYHGQISARLSDDRWSENYRRIWDAVCLQLGWYEHDAAGPRDRLARTLLRRTRYGRRWAVESPVLSAAFGLSRTASIACKTLFGFDLVTDGWGAGEPLATGWAQPGETLAVMRLLPYLDYLIEVGSGNGYFAFLAAQHGAAVTALEPSPLEYKQLRSGMALNGFSDIAAPVCSAGESASGGALYLESGLSVKPLSLADYRATGSLVRLALAGVGLPLLTGAADWLAAYDAPVVIIAAEAAGVEKPPAAARELARHGYGVYAVNGEPGHGAPLLWPLEGAPRGAAGAYLALPPMAQDLAEPLARPVDMRVFTATAKLENLFYFVKNSFEEL